MINDLRQFISKAEEWGEVKTIEGVNWDLELNAITQLMAKDTNPPVLLFDKIKDYPPGYRVVTNLFNTDRRIALGLGLPPDLRGIELVKALRDKQKEGSKPIPPREVKTGPVKENIITGDDINVFAFPAPKWNALDGGRYIGTGTMTVMRDPDNGWLNLGAYRSMLQSKNTISLNITPGHHGDIIQRKYWKQGKSCPAALVCGQEPTLWSAACTGISWGTSEYDYAGGFKQAPIEVTRGVTTDLLLPATAEIILEGEILPLETKKIKEGPFGDWTGHYTGGKWFVPEFKVNAILHRNNPIIQGAPPSPNVVLWTLGSHIQRAAKLWEELDRQMPGVKGVWMVPGSTSHGLAVISLEQQYSGHAKQATMVAKGCLPTAYGQKFIVVVDEDVDPSDINEVMWAMTTRNDPGDSIEVIKGFWDSRGDSTLHPSVFPDGPFEHSAALIRACKPYGWIKQFPISFKISDELAKKTREKWPQLFKK